MTAQAPTDDTAEMAASHRDGGLSACAPYDLATLRHRKDFLAA